MILIVMKKNLEESIMKKTIVLMVVAVLFNCNLWSAPESALLELSIESPVKYVVEPTFDIIVNRYHEGFGLGGMVYDLQISENLEMISRSYEMYGWVANDNILDNCIPLEGGIFTGDIFSFMTVVKEESEFASGSSGIVEKLTFKTPADEPERWVYFDFSSPSVQAANAVGEMKVDSYVGTL
jgi:uncharacterized membrane protein